MKRHDLDLVSLLAGVVFLAVAASHLIGQALGSPLDATWVVPITLVALGLAGMIGGLGRSLRRPVAADVPAGSGAEVSGPADGDEKGESPVIS
jgi:hypothetical protein